MSISFSSFFFLIFYLRRKFFCIDLFGFSREICSFCKVSLVGMLQKGLLANTFFFSFSTFSYTKTERKLENISFFLFIYYRTFLSRTFVLLLVFFLAIHNFLFLHYMFEFPIFYVWCGKV